MGIYMESLKMYVLRGARFGFAALLISLALSFLLQQTRWKKTGADRKGRSLWFWAIWYFVTLELVVFWGRDTGFIQPMSNLNLHLFENLRDAVRGSGQEVLVQVGLNLLMFVPGGFLLGWLLEEKNAYAVPLTLLGIILFNETAQFFIGLGAADIDDLASNLLGGLWGWAIFLLFRVWKRKGVKRLAYAGAALLPPLLAIGLFAAYQAKPWGYLPQDVINDRYLKPETVDVSAIEDVLPESLSLYEPQHRGKSGAKKAVAQIFAALGEQVDFNNEDAYDTLIVYRGENMANSIWYEYRGAFKLHLSNTSEPTPYQELPVLDRTLAILADMGYPLPLPTNFEDTGTSWRTLVYDFVPEGGTLYDGTVEVSYMDGQLLALEYDVTELAEYRIEPALDAKKLAERLKQGRFTGGLYDLDSLEELICLDYSLDYALDSKDIYRPVYVISCTMNGRETEITVSAI